MKAVTKNRDRIGHASRMALAVAFNVMRDSQLTDAIPRVEFGRPAHHRASGFFALFPSWCAIASGRSRSEFGVGEFEGNSRYGCAASQARPFST